jgi:prevent-host-death family protein
MENVWQIQEAQNNLEELIVQAQEQGPQVIEQSGEKKVVIISYAEYGKLRKSQGKLSEFFRSSPLAGIELSRDQSLPRKPYDEQNL